MPKISFITPMKEKDFRVIAMLKSIRAQNYPQDRIEIIIVDGGSNPAVLDACAKYDVRIFDNPKKLAEGAGNGKDQGIWKSTGDYIVISESDIEYVDRDWIVHMLRPFLEHADLFGAVPKLYINPRDNPTNRYLSYVGVDPFALYRALEGVLEFTRVSREQGEGYSVIALDPKEPYCMGSNGFMFKRSLIADVGDYAQDVEFIARLARKGHTRFAYVKNARVWHKNVKSLHEFTHKRIKWTTNYSRIYHKEKKDFNWITNKPQFFWYVARNLLFLPNIPISIKKSTEYRDAAWLLHAPLLFFSTLLNVYFSLTSRSMMQQALGA